MRIEPVAIALEGGLVVRGQCWGDSPNWTILVHAPGEDLDAWGDLPARGATAGHAVLALDLPGHGLSDAPADPTTPAPHADAIAAALAHAAAQGARRSFLVVAGRAVAPALAALRREPVAALVALSPDLAADDGNDAVPRAAMPPALVMVGGLDADASTAAGIFFRDRAGWAALSTIAVPEQGTALFRSAWGDQAAEQVFLFLRDFRV